MRREYSYVSLTLLTAFYFVVALNLPFYAELTKVFGKLDGVSVGFVVSIPFFLFFVLIIVFSVFSMPVLSKPLFILLVIISSMVSYAAYNYRVIFDQDMLVNVFETNRAEAEGYLSLYSLLWVTFLGIIPAIFIYKIKIKPERSWLLFIAKKAGVMLTGVLGIALIAVFFYKDYASVGRNNRYLQKTIIPTYYLKSTYQAVKDKFFSTPIEYKQLGLDAKQRTNNKADKPTLLVFLVGETARVQNQQYYGYERPTNAYTLEYQPLYFTNVASCGTATATSLPCMFSSLTKDTFKRGIEDNQDNALDIMQRAGVDISWLENDGGDKNVAQNIDDYVRIKGNVDERYCNGKTCYDEVFLNMLDERVTNIKEDKVIFLHLIGSHGPTYWQRYPRDMAVYLPDCQRADIENCSQEEIVNTYDNTLNYTDYVTGKVIDRLSGLEDKYNTALVYVSDHGESLGESGIYLHGLPYKIAPETQTKVPLLMWFSGNFPKVKGINLDCLQAKTKDGYSHDNLFHTLLGIMDVSTEMYQPEKDIFAACRQ